MASYYYQDPSANEYCYHCIDGITDNLYLTGKDGARNYGALRAIGINTIISLTLRENFRTLRYPGMKYKRVEVPDDPTVRIDHLFDQVADRIHRGGRVLVHCYVGMSRAPTFVMAYLMKYHRMTLSQAYTLVRRQRPLVQPNCGFWRQLIEYERKLYGQVSVAVGQNGCY